jgi:hypothetical protein
VPRATLRRRILLNRLANLAKNTALVFVAVVVLFTAVLGLLAVASWASDRGAAASTSKAF